jgi:thymidylate synthase ThyX
MDYIQHGASFKCTVVADSEHDFFVRKDGKLPRITTMIVTYPRIIHGEMMTHRVFSRNSASSRAIPTAKMIRMVEEEPFIPIAWQKRHRGMQGSEYITEKTEIQNAISTWLKARDEAVKAAKLLGEEVGVTKQIANRLLEPFMWHTVIITATEWTNFFQLRCSTMPSEKDIVKKVMSCPAKAEIHIKVIADMMKEAMEQSTPNRKVIWHTPMVEEWNENSLKVSTARCARLSYYTLGDNPQVSEEEDIRLWGQLLREGHMSPFEHCAVIAGDCDTNTRNFIGWRPYRQSIEEELSLS